MCGPDVKADLHHYLREARAALVWKLDGLSEYDVRRPLPRTGTNLLGLVKHLSGVETLYLGEVFGRPFAERIDWVGPDVPANTDMWADADQSRAQLVGLYGRAGAHADATIAALDLDAVGHVPWWPADGSRPTLHRVLVHLIAETHRHAGHADIVRELIDGSVGLRAGPDNFMPAGDDAWWSAYHDLLERTARRAVRREEVPARP
ncbi:MAG TPA: DinB family protein [Pilimelia sp.]|nr:DinB family protein [Pilimelia sp.]